MTRQQRYEAVLDYFRREMPEVDTELHYGSIFQLLVAVMLSAQCTDRRINQVTPALFAQWPDAKSLAEAEEWEVYEYIRSVSYPNAKAHHLVEMARMLVSDFGGEVPTRFDDLVKLPGVGRKTANVIEAVAYGRAAMPVDTHVYRVSHRMALVAKTDNTPYKVEQKLKAHIPADELARAHHWLLLHGRYVCMSRKPKCEQCPFTDFCPKRLEDSKVRS
ncbi:MAG: endonuclease III [Prevotella sp.]|nr:endonuclease III [Prevotella sp.]MDD7046610.1 endonuclease III [Prevotella sp.]MDY5546279.1 endonuclease III [Prevotella sp.]